jgi:hypothetical protein
MLENAMFSSVRSVETLKLGSRDKMAEEIQFSHVVTTKATLKLDEAELGALDALVGYGIEGFLKRRINKKNRDILDLLHRKGVLRQ